MPRFVVYEVWTKATVIEAESKNDAYMMSEPEARDDLRLSNWHVVELDDKTANGRTGDLT